MSAADFISVMWNANPPEEQVLGYLVYVGTTPGVYLEVYDVGDQTSFVYPGAVPGQEYFFAIAAHNIEGEGPPSEVFGFSNAPPSLVNPGNQTSPVGQAVTLQLQGSDIYGDALSYSASGLPPGLTLSQSTGLISGEGTAVGIYNVTVTVTDGVLSAQQGFGWLIDGGPPTVAIISPTPQATYSTVGGTVALGGVASDDVGVAVIRWTTSGGGEGIATGTTSWTIPVVPLLLGQNVITVTAEDAAGHTATAVIMVTSVGITPPTVAITVPTSAPSYVTSASSIGLGGTASDNVGITAVTWVTDRALSGTAIIDTSFPPTSTAWNAPAVSLLTGSNVITVTASSASGSSTAIIRVILNRPPTLTSPGDRTNAEGDVVSLQLVASDPDGDPITYTAAGLPPGLTLNGISGLISGTLLYTAAGVYSTTLSVSDGLNTTSAFLTWTVSNTSVTVIPVVIAANKPYDRTTSATLASCRLSAAGTGPVAMYSFDEGLGTTVMDSSGYGNQGAIFSATWIAGGRYGGGLSVEANGTHVRIPNSASLGLTTGMTLEAWIKPETVTSDWRDVIYKGNDSYYLSATSSPAGRPAAGGTFGTTIVEAYGQAALVANTWAHLTATYDNVALRLYVNGVEVSRVDRTGSLNTAASPLEIGGDSIFGQYFAGVIDEVRVYNVALTSAQIQAEMMIGSDAVGCTGTATLTSASAGPAKTVTVTDVTLTGPAAAEFTLATTTATTTAAVGSLPVTVVVTAADKLYDGTAGATLTSCTVTGVIGEEAVGCAGTATFDTAGAGAGKRVTVTSLALSGADAGNYALAATSATTTAGIQPLTVTPTVTVADKRYDGTTGATLTSCTVMGVVVGCTGTATFDTASVGTGKMVTVTNLALTGANAGNYMLPTTTTTTTATIYDQNRAPVVTNPGAQGSFQGTSITLAITATDPDGDPLTFSAANLPPGLSINPSMGVVSGAATAVGSFSVVISASDGSATGQASFSWNITSLLPTPATPVSPSGSIATTMPAFSWTADGSAAYYALSVSDASAGSPTIAWYTPTGAACPLGGTCSVPAPKTLASGLITWAVITWNPIGYGPWSATKSAVVDFADAALRAPEPVGPLGPIPTRTPTYTWKAISDATWYQLSITDTAGVVREFWYSPSQACDSATCAVTPNALLAIGAARWQARAWQASGSGAWTAPVLFEAADSAPGTATLVSPLSPVTTVTPSFTWNAVLGTSYYLLRVTNRDDVTVDRWYLPAAAGCPSGTGTCTASPGISLTAGAATWSVLTWNGSGYGPWSATREFLVEIADPAAHTPAAVSPLDAIVGANTTYRWTAVAGALSYRLSIGNNGGAPVYWWVTAAAAGCDAGGECSTSPEVALLNDTAQWRVQAWTTIGYGSWSPVVTVTVNIPAPPAPTLVSPDGAAGSTSPAFRWNASANATLYYIRAYDPAGLRVDKWLTPLQAGCVSGGVCTLNAGVTLASGAGSWQVIAWNPAGYSPWSSTLAFTVP